VKEIVNDVARIKLARRLLQASEPEAASRMDAGGARVRHVRLLDCAKDRAGSRSPLSRCLRLLRGGASFDGMADRAISAIEDPAQRSSNQIGRGRVAKPAEKGESAILVLPDGGKPNAVTQEEGRARHPGEVRRFAQKRATPGRQAEARIRNGHHALQARALAIMRIGKQIVQLLSSPEIFLPGQASSPAEWRLLSCLRPRLEQECRCPHSPY
jgi:hypothetical protein